MLSFSSLTIVLALVQASISNPTIQKTVEARQGYWQPHPPLKWQIVSTFDIGDPNIPGVDVYEVDLYSTSKEDVETLKKNGKKVICYFSAGTWEEDRPDSDKFKQEDLGNPVGKGEYTSDGYWPGEYWLNIRNSDVLDRMIARMQDAKDKGCDAVDPDNIDGFDADRALTTRSLNLRLDAREHGRKGRFRKHRPSKGKHPKYKGSSDTNNSTAGGSGSGRHSKHPKPNQDDQPIEDPEADPDSDPESDPQPDEDSQPDSDPSSDPDEPTQDPEQNESTRATTGWDFTPEDAVTYLRKLSNEAHKRGLAIGIKNAIDILDEVWSFMDYAINEQCVANNECRLYQRFLNARKPVFHIEYASNYDLSEVPEDEIERSCAADGVALISSVIKRYDLDPPSIFCDGTRSP